MARKLLEDTAIGRMGCKIVTGTAATTAASGTYYAVQFITNCTPTTFTISGGTGTFSGVTYSAGGVVYGDITAITAAASETYILYLA
tara:strand:+ start:1074 stop:1334 length:261 start_codon:yes stop_codon:yes gene_type:complete